MTKKIKVDEVKEQENEAKIAELSAGWQRCQADFLNYKKQIESDRQRLIKTANEELISEILPVLDNFQLAAKHVPAKLEGNNWVAGIKQIEKQLESVLSSESLELIKTVGEQFDPQFHEAVEYIDSEMPADEILDEILPGYIFGGQVLRPAKVKVSRGK